MGKLKNVPHQRHPCPRPWNLCLLLYLAKYKQEEGGGLCGWDYIKVLTWGDYPESSGVVVGAEGNLMHVEEKVIRRWSRETPDDVSREAGGSLVATTKESQQPPDDGRGRE